MITSECTSLGELYRLRLCTIHPSTERIERMQCHDWSGWIPCIYTTSACRSCRHADVQCCTDPDVQATQEHDNRLIIIPENGLRSRRHRGRNYTCKRSTQTSMYAVYTGCVKIIPVLFERYRVGLGLLFDAPCIIITDCSHAGMTSLAAIRPC